MEACISRRKMQLVCVALSQAFLLFLMSERAINLLHESSVTSRVVVLSLKKIIDERIKNLIVECPKCEHDRREHILRHLINAFFNTGHNNLIMLLNRVDDTKKITLNMVKSLKNNGNYVTLSKEKN